jgi:uncharacterized protein YbdZ (MbtH family)
VSINPFDGNDGRSCVLLDDIEQHSRWSAASMFQPASGAGLRLWTTSNELDR